MFPSSEQVIVLLMTLLRVVGIVALLPAGTSSLGMLRTRAAVAVLLVLLIGINTSGVARLDAWLPIVAIHELALGVCFGFGIRVLFVAAHVLAELLLHSSGLAQVAFQQAMGTTHATGITRFLELTLITVFFATDGHRVLISNLLRSLVDIPIGAFDFTQQGAGVMLGFLARSFELGVYASFPLLASAGIALVVTGIIHRLIPQLASMMSSAGIGYMFLLVTLLLGIGALSGLFESGIAAYADGFTAGSIMGNVK